MRLDTPRFRKAVRPAQRGMIDETSEEKRVFAARQGPGSLLAMRLSPRPVKLPRKRRPPNLIA